MQLPAGVCANHGRSQSRTCWMSDYEFTLSLRIRHPRMDPSVISEELSIKPQHTWKAGDRRLDAAGDAIEGSYRESYWMARLMEHPQLSSEQQSLEGRLMQTLAQLQRSQSFLEKISAEQGVAELHVSLYAREEFSLPLSADSLALLGRLRLAITLDIHPHSPRSS
jgi:hypothetical protein